MAKFIHETLGMVNPKDLLETGFMISRPSDPLEGLFDDQQTSNLVATYSTIASEYQIPQMAQFHAFDAPAQKSIAAPIDQHNIEKGLIKVKRPTSEYLRQLLGQGITVESELYRYVMDFAAGLADQVITRTKIARTEVIATGKMTINENNISATIDYGVPAENTSITIDFGAGADVPAQIGDIIDKAATNGVTITGIITSRSFLSKMRQNSDVQRAVNGPNMQGVLVSNAALRAWLEDEFGITQVITDDLTYSLPYYVDNDEVKVTPQRYYPLDTITFFGTANGMKLGTSLWGIPPENEIGSYYDVSNSTLNPYVYITQWAESDPAILWTKASALYVPVLFNPNSLYIAKAIETPGA